VAQEAIPAFCLSGMQAAGWVVVVELPSQNPYRKTTITALAAIAAPVTPAEAKADVFGAEMAITPVMLPSPSIGHSLTRRRAAFELAPVV